MRIYLNKAVVKLKSQTPPPKKTKRNAQQKIVRLKEKETEEKLKATIQANVFHG